MKIPLTIVGYILAAYALAEIQTVMGIRTAWLAFGGIVLLMAAIGIKYGERNGERV